MLNWIRRKLGITALETQAQVASRAIKRIEGKLRQGRRPQRRDQIERARARPRKAAHSV